MTAPPLRIGSACSGYGGLDLAVRSVLDSELTWCADIDAHAIHLLGARFPGVPMLGDITRLDWRHVPTVDVLTCGWPCADISTAGPGTGLQGDRSGIWPHLMAGIRLLRPSLVLLENVAALRWRGLDTVLADLATAGYDTAWCCLRAADIGAPHLRERIFIAGRPARRAAADAHPPGPRPPRRRPPRGETSLPAVDQPQRHRRPPAAPHHNEQVDWGPYTPAIRRWEHTLHRPAPDPVDRDTAGRPRLAPAFSEWLMGLDPGWVTATALPRSGQLQLLGRGVVPQQAARALRTLLPRLTTPGPDVKGTPS